MRLACAFPPGIATPDHVVLAEKLGYHDAWCYDSPGMYADVWMTLAAAAVRTEQIVLGPAAIVPSLRHVAVTASAIATLDALAPGRVAVVIGSGYTGRFALGQSRAMPWGEVREYARALRDLLNGDTATYGGAALRMLHGEGMAPGRPIKVPMLFAAEGPKGFSVARELGDGLFTGFMQPMDGRSWAKRLAVLVFGTVLRDGETARDERVVRTMEWAAAMSYHWSYVAGSQAIDALPNGEGWRALADATPPGVRHLHVHDQHHLGLNAFDRAVLDAEVVAGLVPRWSITGDLESVRARLLDLRSAGTTDIVVQPSPAAVEEQLREWADLVTSL